MTVTLSYFEPLDGDASSPSRKPMGLCGPGSEYQVNIQLTENPSFCLVAAAPEGHPNHDPGLVKLAEETNKAFEKAANQALAKARKEYGYPRLQLTLRIAPEGLRLIYSYPHDRPSLAPLPRRILFPRIWYGLSGLVFRLKRKHRLPDDATTRPPAPRTH